MEFLTLCVHFPRSKAFDAPVEIIFSEATMASVHSIMMDQTLVAFFNHWFKLKQKSKNEDKYVTETLIYFEQSGYISLTTSLPSSFCVDSTEVANSGCQNFSSTVEPLLSGHPPGNGK